MSEVTRILAHFTQWLCMHMSQIMHVTKKKLINTKRLTFFIINVYYSHKMNGNLFAFNCIDICSELRLNAAFCIIVRDEPFVWFMYFISLIFT